MNDDRIAFGSTTEVLFLMQANKINRHFTYSKELKLHAVKLYL